MADEIVGGLRGIQKELKAVQDQMAGLDAGSEQFGKLARKAGELKDKMKDVKEVVNSQAGPAIENLGNSADRARGQLMSLDFEGFGESLKLVGGNIKNINFSVIKDGLGSIASGFSAIANALLSNPIFLIAGVLALIAMNMDKVYKLFPSFERALKGIGDEERAIAAAVEARAAASKKAYDQSSLEVNQMKLAGKTEREISEYRMARLKTSIADAKIQLETSINQAKIQTDTAKRNREILEGIIKFVNAPISIITGLIDNIGKVVGKDFGLTNKMTGFLASFVVDPEEMKGEFEKTITAQKDALKQMESDYLGYQITLNEIDQKGIEKKKETAKETVKVEKQEKIDRNKILTQYNEEQAEDDIALAAEVADKNAAMSQALTDKERANAVELHGEKKSLVADLNETEKEVFNARLERSDIETQHQIENEKKLRDAKFAARDAALKLAKEGEEAIANVGAAYFATKMSRIDRETKEGAAAYEVLAKKQFEFNKKMQLAGAIIDLARGINSSLASAPVAIGPAPNPAGIASLAFVTATGLANIAKIAATKYQSSTAPGGTSPSPNLSSGGGGGQSPAALNLSALQGNVNTAPIQSYVLAGQVSSAQQAEFKIKNTASILGGG
jgi:hypothetical protein